MYDSIRLHRWLGHSSRWWRALGLFLPGARFSNWYVISIDTGHRAQSPQSGPRWRPAFKTEPVLFPPSCSDSCPFCWWCHPTTSSAVAPFSSCPQSFPASVFPNESALCMRWPKYWSFSFSIVLPVSIQGWFPLGFTGLISLLSKEFSRDFSGITVRKHPFFGAQLYLWFNSHIHTLLEKP